MVLLWKVITSFFAIWRFVNMLCLHLRCMSTGYAASQWNHLCGNFALREFLLFEVQTVILTFIKKKPFIQNNSKRFILLSFLGKWGHLATWWPTFSHQPIKNQILLNQTWSAFVSLMLWIVILLCSRKHTLELECKCTFLVFQLHSHSCWNDGQTIPCIGRWECGRIHS